MNTTDHRKQSLAGRINEFFQTIFSSEFWRGVKRDLKDIYVFYIDDETRQQYKKMRVIRRSFKITVRMLGALYSKLTAVRKALLILSFVLFFFPRTGWESKAGALPSR